MNCAMLFAQRGKVMSDYDKMLAEQNRKNDADIIEAADEFAAIPLSANTMSDYGNAKNKLIAVARKRRNNR